MMAPFFGAAMLAGFGISAGLCSRALAAPRAVDRILAAWLVASGEILLSGYGLSLFEIFDRPAAWALAGAVWLAVGVGLAASRPIRRLRWPAIQWSSIPTRERSPLALASTTVAVLGLIQLVNAFRIAPFSIDGLTYHLARVGYYLQQGSLGPFDANYPAQTVQGRGSAVLLSWAFLAADRRESAMLLVSYASYWIGIVAVYGIARRLDVRRTYSALAAALFGLLPIALMQATAPMSDLIGAGYIGCAAYFVTAFGRFGRRALLAWSAVGWSTACAVKATGLLAGPALYLVGWTTARSQPGKVIATLAVASSIALALIALPAGYVDNYLRYGNALTPSAALEPHSLVGKPLPSVAAEGSRNVLRLALDFLSLDGLPPIEPVNRVQRLIRLPAAYLAGVTDIERPSGPRIPPFAAYRDPRAREEYAYWGILGIGLLWLLPWIAAFGVTHHPQARPLAAAAIVYFLTVAYAGAYDPWRGRLFLAMAMFALPAIACHLEQRQSRAWRLFTSAVVLLGCGSAVSAVVFREHATLVSASYGDRSVTAILGQDRPAQLTAHIPRYADAVRRYEATVPRDATVAIYGDYMFEYVFFGERLTRRLVPLGDGTRPMRPIPPGVDYLVFSSKARPPGSTDELLGADWYLRRVDAGPPSPG